MIMFEPWPSHRGCRVFLIASVFFLVSLSLILIFYPTTVNFDSFAPFFFSSSRGSPVSSTESPSESWYDQPRIAVCLVGGARRFELTGPSILKNILEVHPNSDLYVHSPLDSNSYKLSVLKSAPRIAAVRVFVPTPINETASHNRVMSPVGSPKGMQGLLQYFSLVEGCLTMITDYQNKNNFTYEWIVRTRLDSYWAGPLASENFISGNYVVPRGSSYGGLNDRLGVGQLNNSAVALSRFSLLPKLDAAGFRRLNSEGAFKAQLTTHSVSYVDKPIPFCVVTDHTFSFPQNLGSNPVASLSSPEPLSGAYCRPCQPTCNETCTQRAMNALNKGWNWVDPGNGTLQLCHGYVVWEKGWEEIFDKAAGKALASKRKSVLGLKENTENCVKELEEMMQRTSHWDAPAATEICKLGLSSSFL